MLSLSLSLAQYHNHRPPRIAAAMASKGEETDDHAKLSLSPTLTFTFSHFRFSTWQFWPPMLAAALASKEEEQRLRRTIIQKFHFFPLLLSLSPTFTLI